MNIVDHQTRVILGTQRSRVSFGGTPNEQQKELSVLFEEFSHLMGQLRTALNSESLKLQSFLALVVSRDTSGEMGDAGLQAIFSRLCELREKIVTHGSYASREDEIGTDIFNQEKNELSNFMNLKISISAIRYSIGELI